MNGRGGLKPSLEEGGTFSSGIARKEDIPGEKEWISKGDEDEGVASCGLGTRVNFLM